MSDTPSDTTAAGEEADPSASPVADRPDKLRLRIAGEAGRMLADRGGDARRAGFRAARRVGRGWVPPQHLPDAGEIRRETERAMVQGSDAPAGKPGLPGDRFDRMAELVRVLGAVKRDPVKYPEGDALEHSLQVFARVSEECPWDEELLTAALVHDIGLAIDRSAAVAVALEELADLATARTRWLVEMLPVATALHAGTLGHRSIPTTTASASLNQPTAAGMSEAARLRRSRKQLKSSAGSTATTALKQLATGTTTTLSDPTTTPDTRRRGCRGRRGYTAFHRGHASPGGGRGRLADRLRPSTPGCHPLTCGMPGKSGYTADGAC